MNRLLIPIAIFCIILSACRPDSACEDVVCLNNGVCESGECLCSDGFEGYNCETEQRLAFVNDYNVSESCNLGDFSYEVTMNAESVLGNELTITNFGDFDHSVVALVDGLNLIIERQVHSGDTIWGSGLMTDSIVTIEYSLISNQADSLNCSILCTP